MKCLACGAEMRLMDVRTDTAAPFGIERRVFQCLSCRQLAQRLRLNRPRMAIAHSRPRDFEPQLEPSGTQSERANVVVKRQAVAARASAWARAIEKLRERQMALKERGAPRVGATS